MVNYELKSCLQDPDFRDFVDLKISFLDPGEITYTLEDVSKLSRWDWFGGKTQEIVDNAVKGIIGTNENNMPLDTQISKFEKDIKDFEKDLETKKNLTYSPFDNNVFHLRIVPSHDTFIDVSKGYHMGIEGQMFGKSAYLVFSKRLLSYHLGSTSKVILEGKHSINYETNHNFVKHMCELKNWDKFLSDKLGI